MADLRVRALHPWDLPPEAAIAVQRDLAGQVERADRLGPVQRIAGLDVGFPRRGETVMARAAAVLLDATSMELLAQAVVEEPVRYPYVPGLLSFREAPALLAALARLPARPDLLLLDGQGLAHPRRIGIACHLGLLLDLPAVGCAKSRLVGVHADVPVEAGAWVPLEDRGEIVGAVVRSRAGVKPLYVSIGHRVGLDTAVALVLACGRGRRLPEPTRLADALASQRGGRARLPPHELATLADRACNAAGAEG